MPRYLSFWAASTLAVASITDFLDGWIARNWGLSTAIGRFLDPLADKLLVIACLVMAVYLDRVPAWFVVLLISREISIASLRSVAASEGLEIAVAQTGKWKTAFQMIGLLGILIHYEYVTDFGFFEGLINYNRVGLWLLSASLVLSISSAFQYFYRFAVAAALMDAELDEDPAE
jgi:CDP-diacylglycerol--glycerol-3-phosphate 3-phosphatidyltransferase